MPLMSGPALGQEMKKTRPDIHVMLMSGGAPRLPFLVLNYGWAYIDKPFLKVKLTEMVNHVLHSADAHSPAETNSTAARQIVS